MKTVTQSIGKIRMDFESNIKVKSMSILRRRNLLLGMLGGCLGRLTLAHGASVPARLRSFGVYSPIVAGGLQLGEYVSWLGRYPNFVSDNADQTSDFPHVVSSTRW